jgi:hypothetical protein
MVFRRLLEPCYSEEFRSDREIPEPRNSGAAMIQNNFRLARMVLMLVPLLGCAGDGIVIADGEQAAVSKRVLRVGPGQKYSKPSVAARSARNGDVIEIAAGVYERDAAAWTQNNLTIRGVGGRAHLRANGANIEGKGT